MGRWSTSSASRLVGLLAALVLVAGLLSGAEAKRLRPGEEALVKGAKTPRWVTEPVKEDTKSAKAFCGVSHNLSSEGEARADALRSAREQIVDAIGTYGTHVLEQVSSSSGGTGGVLDPAVVMDNAIQLVSEGHVATRARTFHIEKWQKAGESGLEYYFKAYVLVLWDNKDAAEAAQQAVREATQAATDTQTQANVNRALERMKDLQAHDW